MIEKAVQDVKRLERAENFSRKLGYLIATSGMAKICPINSCRLDWAAIQLEDSRFPQGFSNVSVAVYLKSRDVHPKLGQPLMIVYFPFSYRNPLLP